MMTTLNQRQASACDEEHFCYYFDCDNCNTSIANFSLMCCQCSKSQEFCMETNFGSEYGVSFNIPHSYKLKVLDYRKKSSLNTSKPSGYYTPSGLKFNNSRSKIKQQLIPYTAFTDWFL